MATIVNYGKSTAGARMQLQCVGVLGEPSELWPANATLPAVHERLLERYAAGLRYVYGTEAEVIEYATSHHAPHPQLSRELLDAIEDGGVVVSINADQRGDAGDAVPPLGGDGAPTLEKRLGGGAGHDVESLTARRSGDGPVFGRSLEQGCLWHGVRHATPVLLQRAVHYLNSHPDVLVTEGLFRVPGDAKVVQLLRQRFDDGLDVDLSSVPGITVHVVASLLAQYLRQSRPPAIPSAFRARFIAYAQVPPRHQVDYLRVVLNELPSAHVRSLDLLCAFLLRLASHESATRMSVANLALVFGPCLVAADEVDIEDPLALRVASEQANDVVAFLIEHHAELFLAHVDAERLGSAVATVRDTHVPDASSGELMLRRKQPLFLLRRLEPSDVTRWRAANAARRRRCRPTTFSGAALCPKAPAFRTSRSRCCFHRRASVPFAFSCTGEGGAADLDTDAASASSGDDDTTTTTMPIATTARTSSGEMRVDAVLVVSSKAKARPTGRRRRRSRPHRSARVDAADGSAVSARRCCSAPARCCAAPAASSRRRRPATRPMLAMRRAPSDTLRRRSSTPITSAALRAKRLFHCAVHGERQHWPGARVARGTGEEAETKVRDARSSERNIMMCGHCNVRRRSHHCLSP
jgi:hypothetical protein